MIVLTKKSGSLHKLTQTEGFFSGGLGGRNLTGAQTPCMTINGNR